ALSQSFTTFSAYGTLTMVARAGGELASRHGPADCAQRILAALVRDQPHRARRRHPAGLRRVRAVARLRPANAAADAGRPPPAGGPLRSGLARCRGGLLPARADRAAALGGVSQRRAAPDRRRAAAALADAARRLPGDAGARVSRLLRAQ